MGVFVVNNSVSVIIGTKVIRKGKEFIRDNYKTLKIRWNYVDLTLNSYSR